MTWDHDGLIVAHPAQVVLSSLKTLLETGETLESSASESAPNE